MTSSDDPGPKPRLRVVPEADEATRKRLEDEARQHEQESRRSFAETHLRIALRELSFNVLRIVRGAGKPWALAQDCANVLDAVDEYEAFDTWPPSHVIGGFPAVHGRASGQRGPHRLQARGRKDDPRRPAVRRRSSIRSHKCAVRKVSCSMAPADT